MHCSVINFICEESSRLIRFAANGYNAQTDIFEVGFLFILVASRFSCSGLRNTFQHLRPVTTWYNRLTCSPQTTQVTPPGMISFLKNYDHELVGVVLFCVPSGLKRIAIVEFLDNLFFFNFKESPQSLRSQFGDYQAPCRTRLAIHGLHDKQLYYSKTNLRATEVPQSSFLPFMFNRLLSYYWIQ